MVNQVSDGRRAVGRRVPRKRQRLVASVPTRVSPAVLPGSVGEPLVPLIAAYTATFGSTWGPVTRRKHGDDFERFLSWLIATNRPTTTASLEFVTLVGYVEDLRSRPKLPTVRRPDAEARAALSGQAATLSANSVNAYVRPIRSLAIWLVDEGRLPVNPFRRSRRRASLNPLLPSEDTPTKSATLEDLQAIERGCAGDQPVDWRDRAIVSVLKTTAARNSSVRMLSIDDVDLARDVIRYRRAKGGKTLEVALHRETKAAVLAYLEHGRPDLLAAAVAATNALASTPQDPGFLFLSSNVESGPRALTMSAISTMLNRRYHRGGGTLGRFGSHRIRHATATMLVNNGMPLEEVSRFLGHSSTMPTRRYAQQSPGALGVRAAEALERAGLVAP